MQNSTWLKTVGRLVIVPTLALTAYAKEPAFPGPRPNGFQVRLEKAVGLTSDQREAVGGLLAQQREDLKSLRDSYTPKFAAVQEQTDGKIRALLNPDQQKKFDTFLAKQKQEKKSKSRRPS